MAEGIPLELEIAIDMNRQRKEAEMRRVLDRLHRTIQVQAMRPEDDEAVQSARASFTTESMAVIAPLIEAADILWAIICASDGCAGHRNCIHSMEPWQRARDLLYRNAQRREDAAPSPAETQKRHFDEAFGDGK